MYFSSNRNQILDTYLNARALAQENSDLSSNDMVHNDLPMKTKKRSIPIRENKNVSPPPTCADLEGKLL